MNKEHHRHITKLAISNIDIDLSYPNSFPYTVSEIIEMSVIPDDWNDVIVDSIIDIKAASFLHFEHGYSTKLDPSLRTSTWGRLLLRADPEVEIADWLDPAFRDAGNQTTDLLLHECHFPSMDNIRDLCSTIPNLMARPRTCLSFLLHSAQDKEVYHHNTGLLFNGHKEFEGKIEEVALTIESWAELLLMESRFTNQMTIPTEAMVTAGAIFITAQAVRNTKVELRRFKKWFDCNKLIDIVNF